MLHIRFESSAPLKELHELAGKVAVVEHFEISFFPGTQYLLDVQVSSDLHLALHHFFFKPEAALQQRGDLLGSKSMSKTTPTARARAYTKDKDAAPAAARSAKPKVVAPHHFFRYVRFGEINVNVSCQGFFVTLNKFQIRLPAYKKHGRLLTSQGLIKSFESHLKRVLLNSAAGSGFSLAKRRLFGFSKKTRQEDDDDDGDIDADGDMEGGRGNQHTPLVGAPLTPLGSPLDRTVSMKVEGTNKDKSESLPARGRSEGPKLDGGEREHRASLFGGKFN
jgi:hypothetical protein